MKTRLMRRAALVMTVLLLLLTFGPKPALAVYKKTCASKGATVRVYKNKPYRISIKNGVGNIKFIAPKTGTYIIKMSGFKQVNKQVGYISFLNVKPKYKVKGKWSTGSPWPAYSGAKSEYGLTAVRGKALGGPGVGVAFGRSYPQMTARVRLKKGKTLKMCVWSGGWGIFNSACGKASVSLRIKG